MNLLDHLEACKTLIEQLPSKPEVELYSGELDNESLKGLNLDGQKCYVFLGCPGGPIPPRKERLKLECDGIFGACVVARIDKDTKGISRQAMRTVNDIANAIDNFRGNSKTNSKLPELQYMEELFSGLKSKTNFSAWHVVWTQRITLS